MNGDGNEIKELVRRAIAVGEENNVLLKKMRRSARLGTILHALYWAIIIGLSVGAFYFLQPYVASLESIWDRSGFASHPAVQQTSANQQSSAASEKGQTTQTSQSTSTAQNFLEIFKNL